jgi:hypothetical protein
MKKAEPRPSAIAALACALAGAVIGLAAERTQAATIYTYTGDRYEFAAPPDAGFHTITGNFTLADPIPPNTVPGYCGNSVEFFVLQWTRYDNKYERIR